jgi:polyhydroxyalkanoate synthase
VHILDVSGAWDRRTDRWRRGFGETLDAAGLGPRRTPARIVHAEPCLTLKGYASEETAARPAVLLIPAPIKRAYIWDLLPRRSVVRCCLEGGFRVYVAQWEAPGAAERDYGLAEYADRLILAGLDAIRAETGQSAVWLAGHSLGGTLAALFAALRPDRVRGLVLLGSPLHFGPAAGQLGALVARMPPAEALPGAGNVPGTLLDRFSAAAAPGTYLVSRWLDWLGSLSDPEAARIHLLVERWTLDEMPLPRRLFVEIVEDLYREDRFLRGSLTIGGKRAEPGRVSMPVLSVIDPRCRIVPPEAVLPFHVAATGPQRVLWYEGDVGVALQHVGMLVGKSAHRRLWPEIVRWMREPGHESGP